MKIYIITSKPEISQDQESRLKAIGELVKIDANKLTKDEVVKSAGDAEIIIAGSSGIESLSEELLAELKTLKFISLLTVGTNWVDLESARKQNISVSNIKGANSESVAEHIWGMILALSKRIYEFNLDARNAGAFEFSKYKGKEVFGKTLGIIGTGDIGSKVARIAKGFNMRILGVNKSGTSVNGIEMVALDQLLKESDVVSVSVPLNNETKDLIGEREISIMKHGAILINCAREEIVNKNAILGGISSGRIFGYGVETEIMKPIPLDDSYFKYKNIIATPHNAFCTEDSDMKSFDLAIENIEKFLQGNPQNLVS